MTPREREIRERMAAFFKGTHTPTGWCDCIHCTAISNAPSDITYLLAQLTTAREIIEVAKAELKEECFCVERSLPCDPCIALAKITEMEKEK